MSQSRASNIQCTLIVSSCDNYSDLWVPFFKLLKIYWPDCPYQVLLITENKVFNDKGIISSKIGVNLDWSTLLSRSLDLVKTPYVLFMLEDFFIREVVETEKLEKILNNMNQSSIDMMRLIPFKGKSASHHLNTSIFNVIPLEARYRVSTQGAFWKLKTLQNLIKLGESPWEFEINGTKRSSVDETIIFAAVKTAILPYRHHVVERGEWFPWEAKRFKKMNIGCDFSKRNTMSWWISLIWITRKYLSKFKNTIIDLWFKA